MATLQAEQSKTVHDKISTRLSLLPLFLFLVVVVVSACVLCSMLGIGSENKKTVKVNVNKH